MAEKKTIEEILGKKPIEIAFYNHCQEILKEAEQSGKYAFWERHFRTLASLDGVRGDFLKIANYLKERAS